MKKILVFTATYNEKENIKKLITLIFKHCSNANVLIIDDNSPDKTAEEIELLKNEFKNISLIKRDSKLGLDTAHKFAYKYALDKGYDYLITMDADLSHDPAELTNFISSLETYPFVIGSRYAPGGKCLMKGRRLLMSKYGNILIKLVLRINCNEFTTSYRGFDLKKLGSFNLDTVKASGYSFFMKTIFEISKRKIEIKEIPITFKDRSQGYSKLPKIEIFRTLLNLFLLILKK
jgi:dolichol-phosphate mannosyltransferase